MRTLLVLALTLFATMAMAIQSPFQPWERKLISSRIMSMDSGNILVGNSASKASSVTMSGDATIANDGVLSMAVVSSDGLNQKRTARATYDVLVDGGVAAAYGLGVTIPADAIIVRSWFYTVTQFVDAGSGTVALHCETANNIFSAADITGNAAGTLVDAVQDGTFAAFDGSGAAGVLGAVCELTATVATADQTAGKLILFVDYIVAE